LEKIFVISPERTYDSSSNCACSLLSPLPTVDSDAGSREPIESDEVALPTSPELSMEVDTMPGSYREVVAMRRAERSRIRPDRVGVKAGTLCGHSALARRSVSARRHMIRHAPQRRSAQSPKPRRQIAFNCTGHLLDQKARGLNQILLLGPGFGVRRHEDQCGEAGERRSW
jgi:hypothetical protein